ncbi:histidinol-phosphate transaminase [candidate division WOR-1 bacterium RIFOXYA12_FULL_43_27]|uniref:Histidinol-phosphate aminotransferase n=1 Tax=candidate division WOR-1 bacterium RIFOXYC2_FULL_46_14 TaxID=1802587 RepID=A0A1F4U4Q3_UNCSA|nr:MAG: histidinol-phosphate transaminase [candidate division WOR-1 bacterium RIFOXYA12_FULL_43_27]OGC20809.1 MAG: histidinol-phosphate transaminase [candidate division WOR-1 bacterium RIFOXYB2_FULL_46_45]OGC31454.1 MAG: histidinol-phosphate transaminase [candidate division WOR-1 bacterium RIFOXYA2_FULL_46_56]OGC39859.1 MAG: histidinol-phosphate transaminase [candidate division WOR-1 bacterium RIFOXYC2_FULL_46_14]
MAKPRNAVSNLKEYIPGKNPEKAKVIKLASNENPLGPSPKALLAIKKELKKISVYPDQNSLLLSRQLSKKFNVSEKNLVIGNGSDEVLQLIAAAYLSSGDEVLISRNTFSTYEFVTRLFDGNPVFVDLKNNTYDLPGFASKSTDKTKIIFLCNPNSPTGTSFTAAELDSFMANIPDNYIVVIDEAYAEYVESEDYPDSLKYVRQGKNVIVLRTFSKLYGLAGLRCGYGIAKEEIIKYLKMVKLPFGVNRLAVAAASAALDDKAFVKKSLKTNKDGKKYLYSQLSPIKTEANFICLDIKKSADEVFLRLMAEGVIIRPLTSFGIPNAIRVTIGTMEQNKKFVAALKKVL